MILNEYDSVFADSKEADDEFDVLFDQEDSLIDSIEGLKENGDPLTGNEGSSSDVAEDRSCDDCNPDYEKDIDASDSKTAPKDAEGTEGYDFEEKPEIDKKDDQTTVDEKDVEPTGEDKYQNEDVEYDFVDDGESGCPAGEAEKRSDMDSNPDYEKDIDASDSKTAPKDAEGTEGYDFEEKPEVGKEDDQTTVDEKDVEPTGEDKYQNEDTDFTMSLDEEDEVIDGEEDVEVSDDDGEVEVDYTADMDAEPAATDAESECGSKCGGKSGCVKEDGEEDVDTGNGELEEDPLDFANPDLSPEGDDEYKNEAAEEIDKEVMDVAAPDGEDSDVEDAIVDDAENEPASDNLEYDFSDEEIIDKLIG